MRRFLTWLVGFAGGIAAAYRFVRRRPALPAPPLRELPPAPEPDPAEALRAKLAESRESADEPEPPEAPAETPPDVEARRRSVHEQARAAIDEMNARE